jgi:cysteine synthase
MSRFLVENDGLFLGSSSACNLVACVKLVQKMGWREGQKVVTVLYVDFTCGIGRNLWMILLIVLRCDSGNRHYSKVRSSFELGIEVLF